MNDLQKRALKSLCRDIETAIKFNEEQYARGVLADFREQFKRSHGAQQKTRCCNRWLAMYRAGVS